MNLPFVIFAISLVGLWLSSQVGRLVRKRLQPLGADEWQDFNVVSSAILTLLGLLIGFSFSMAISRYDQRKNYEEEEANAIGTEYVRSDLLPPANAAVLRDLMPKYLDQRIRFYETRDREELVKINAKTAELQAKMWAEVTAAATREPSPVHAVVVMGMNDVLNRQGYTQAAWWNRIPIAAWVLMALIAICCNVMIGYASHRSGRLIFMILPLAVSISFFLIADIDSPRGGVVLVLPHNLVSLSESMHQN